MPTYDYECKKCKRTFEVFQSMKDDAFTMCPEEHCQRKEWGKGEVKRLLGTGAGLIFKGSGFYSTDYRSDNYKQGAKKDSTAASASSSKESSPKKKATSSAKKSKS